MGFHLYSRYDVASEYYTKAGNYHYRAVNGCWHPYRRAKEPTLVRRGCSRVLVLKFLSG